MGGVAPVAQTTALTVLDDLLAAERTLRHTAETERDTYRRVVGELAEALAPELLERHLRQGDDPSQWPAGRWQSVVPELLSASWRRLGQAEGARTRQAREVARLAQQQLAAAKERESAVREELQAALQQLAQVRGQLAATQAQLAARPTATGGDAASASPPPVAASASPACPARVPADYPPPPILPPTPPPTFRQPPKYYPRDARLLYLLGRTGRARRPWLLDGLGQYEGLRGNSGSLPRSITRLVHSDLVEVLKPEFLKIDLLRLTPAGATTYQALFQEPAHPSELTALLEQHQPDGLEHAALVLAAAQALEDCGMQVTVLPPRVELPGGRVIAADLRVCEPETGICNLVEVERGLGPADKRAAKWRNLLTYQGTVYVVGSDMAEVTRLVEEVVALGQPGRVVGSDLDGLHKRKKQPHTASTAWRWALERVIQP